VDAAEDIYNAAAVLADGAWVAPITSGICRTMASSMRTATSWRGYTPLFLFGDIPVGITVCEDIWYPGRPGRRCRGWPVRA
jgi:NAD+ synthase (glutamine-hydrolysing)